MNVLGHMQQGGYPSPFDRNMATKMGAKSYHWLVERLKECKKENGKVETVDKNTACLLGMRTRHYEVFKKKKIVNFNSFNPSLTVKF